MSDFTTACPECGGSVKFDLDDVAAQRTVRCSRGCSVKLEDQGGGARQVKNSLRDLDRSLAKLNRTIKFKL